MLCVQAAFVISRYTVSSCKAGREFPFLLDEIKQPQYWPLFSNSTNRETEIGPLKKIQAKKRTKGKNNESCERRNKLLSGIRRGPHKEPVGGPFHRPQQPLSAHFRTHSATFTDFYFLLRD